MYDGSLRYSRVRGSDRNLFMMSGAEKGLLKTEQQFDVRNEGHKAVKKLSMQEEIVETASANTYDRVQVLPFVL